METLGSTLSADGRPRAGGDSRFLLSFALHADRPLEPGARHPLDADEVLIGRGSESSCVRSSTGGKSLLTLRFADPRMSTMHARLVRDGDGWSIVDQGSKNGSRVNGEPVERGPLSDGDVIELGGSFFVLRAVPGGAEAAQERASDEPLGVRTLHPELEASIHKLTQVARSTIAVVLRGESGTGKEVFARAIHRASGRKGPFQAVNCGALPQTLVEVELFGCKKGAFSGATADREGLVRSAHGGTVLLDEIGDLPLASQTALLRVIQEHEVLPVGGTRAVPVDVRVIAATHKDLRKLVSTGAFREDLLARLTGFEAQLPPLRERMEDLGLLVRDLLLRLAPDRAADVVLTRRAARALFAHRWPQNVRELEKCLEAALVFAGNEPIDVEHLPPAVVAPPQGGPQRPVEEPRAQSPGDEKRRAELLRLLQEHRGNLSAVARQLGKARFQIQRWIKRYALRPEDYR